MTNTMLWNINDAFIESVHVYICIHVVVVPHQLTCRRCAEFNYVSDALDYMVRKKIRQKVARQLITFWPTVRSRPMPSEIRPSVCNVGVLWPNGLSDRDDFWHTLCPGQQ